MTRYGPYAPTQRTVDRLTFAVDRLRAQLAALTDDRRVLSDALIELTLRIDNMPDAPPCTREAHAALDAVYGQDGW